MNTAGSTLTSEWTPARRRGEAMGYFAMVRSLATASMAPLGLAIAAGFGFHWVFVLSGAMGLVAAIAAAQVPDRPREPVAPAATDQPQQSIARQVALPAMFNVILNSGHPIAQIFIALYAYHRGIEHLEIYFFLFGAATIAAQVLAKFSDRFGRAPAIAAGYISAGIGLTIMMFSTALPPLVLGGMFWAVGSALTAPATMALAVDRTSPSQRGAALGTYSTAFQLSSGGFGLVWGFVIEWFGYDWMYIAAIAILVAGLVAIALNWEEAGGRPLRWGAPGRR
jgi:predicted MFS family arabinose efflux permease